MTPLFEQRVTATLGRCTEIFQERGTQYGDSWRDNQFLALRAVAAKLGIQIPYEKCRAIAAAALFDTKYQRLQGGYKEDSIEDGINYGAFLADEVRQALGVHSGTVSQPGPGAEHARDLPSSNGLDRNWSGYSYCAAPVVAVAHGHASA